MTSIISMLTLNPTQAITIEGPPGGGKSSLAHDIAAHFGIPKERVLVDHAPLADQVDYRGIPVPHKNAESTKWLPSDNFYNYRAGTGRGMILYDDRGQASTQVKNVIARLLLDRKLDSITLDEQVIQLSTTNRVEDKAGSNRDPSHLSNREARFELETNLDDWCQWAMNNNLDPLLIAFIRLRPNLLHDFDPNRPRNPTPRTWEMVSKGCDPSLPRGLFMQSVAGLIGDGPAAEYVGTRDIMSKMPSIDGILMTPDKAEIPTEPAILFAVSTALAMRATKDNFDRVMTYTNRMPIEFGTVLVKDSIMRDPAIKSSKSFTQWAISNASVFV
jgi:hypothetical protein